MFIDTHAHLYHRRFEDDRIEMIARAREAKIQRIILPNIDSTSIDAMLELSAAEKDYCLPCMGVHPCSIKEDADKELEIARNCLFDKKDKVDFFAVGEIGLDYYWDKTFIERQKQAFAEQIDWALELDLPIIIHSRDSLDDCIAIVRQKQNGNLRGVFHCFTGNTDQAKEIIDLNFMMGLGGVATFKNGGLDQVLPDVDPNFLILETDAPFLAPVPHRGKRNESSYVPLIAEKVADYCNLELEELASRTTANAERLFKLS
jgi:TatD DNase family protein